MEEEGTPTKEIEGDERVKMGKRRVDVKDTTRPAPLIDKVRPCTKVPERALSGGEVVQVVLVQ